MVKNLVTPEEQDRIVALYKSGMRPRAIGEMTGRKAKGHIQKILIRAGVYIQERTFVSEKERADILQLYSEGVLASDIAKRFNRGHRHITKIVREAGIARPTNESRAKAREQGKCRQVWENQASPEELETMRSLYRQGLSANDIGKRLGRNGRVVREYLSREGLTRSLRDGVRNAVHQGKIVKVGRTLNRTFFDILTPESAWVLGLIYGDGHVQCNIGEHYSICIAGSKEVCTKIRDLLNPALNVRKMKDTNCWIVSWCSREMVEKLRDYGLYGGNKARIIRLPQLPSDMLGHFLRGYWDADGHWETRGGSCHTTIGSASKGMIGDLQKLLGGNAYSGLTELNGKMFEIHYLNLRVEETRNFARLIYRRSNDAIRYSRKFEEASCVEGFSHINVR